MTDVDQGNHYKVSWKKKHPRAPTVVMDYKASNLKNLLDILDRSEGVRTASTEFLIVHRIDLKTGEAEEVVAHEGNSGLTVVDFREPAKASRTPNVISEVNRILEETRKQTVSTTSKPRIRVKSPTRKFVRQGFFYKAYEATKE